MQWAYFTTIQLVTRVFQQNRLIPDRPGLGVEIDEKVIAKHPFKQEVMHAGHAVLDDGTIVDW